MERFYCLTEVQNAECGYLHEFHTRVERIIEAEEQQEVFFHGQQLSQLCHLKFKNQMKTNNFEVRNYRVKRSAALVPSIVTLRRFAAERFTESTRAQRIFDKALKKLSIGVQKSNKK
jgi:hypothetical protein